MKEKVAQARAQSGVTLIDMCIVIAVAMVLLGNALPSFQATLTRRTLEGHAAELASDVHFVRSQAVANNRALRLSFHADAAGSCYVIHSGSASGCRCSADGSTQCEAGAEALKSVYLPTWRRVRLQWNVGSMAFDPVMGITRNMNTMTLMDDHGRAIHHVVNIAGRLRSCSPGGAIPGYRPC